MKITSPSWQAGATRNLLILLGATLLSACTGGGGYKDGAPRALVNIHSIPNAVPRVEPLAKSGNPASYEVFGKRYYPLKNSAGFVDQGIASWYGTKFHGRKTSSGEPYNMYRMTAAHKTLPLPTYVEVTNLDNQRSVIVKVNDRGPFHGNRVIDLSYVAALKLGITKSGTGRVEIRAIDPKNPTAHRNPQPVKTVASAPAAPSPTTTAAVTTSHYLQVGAFSSLVNAELLLKKLHDVADPDNVHIVLTPSKNSTNSLYRVRIGPLHSDNEARQLVEQLAAYGINNANVIID